MRPDNVDGGNRPVIGMLAHVGPMKQSVYDMPATFVPQVFVDRIVRAGGIPVLLPSLRASEQVLDRLDGLLLPGTDVDPALYGAPRHPRTFVIPDRDAAELAVLDSVLDQGLPILGICRGVQLLNVLRGGTLHQHLPEVVGHEEHSPGEVEFGPQKVSLRPGSRLAAVLGETVVVPCHHHQAIDELGAGLRVTGHADDGVVEAVELDGQPFAVAVQWHAEADPDPRLFLALLAAAADRHDHG